MYWLFGNLETRQAVVRRNPSFAAIEKLRREGFELIWDSAPTADAAFEYAEEFGERAIEGDTAGCGFYRHACNGCGIYRPTFMAVGQRWHQYHDRMVVFRGHVCDGCASDEVIMTVRPV